MVANIPLALLGSLVGLWVTGNTINIMSLGGMALAIGILVDEATVTIENTHVQMEHAPNVAAAVLHASNATAVPRLLALLCILSVFIPAFIMDDPLRSLFMPLTLAVGFAMISSYLLSSTFVPIMCVTLLKHHGGHGEKKPGLFDRMLKVYGTAVGWFVRLRWLTVPIYLVACGLVLGVLGLQVGTELFPQIDSGEFVLRFRPPPGSNFELTRQMALKCLEEIEREAKPEHIADHDGLRRPGRPELRHRQHGAVHARARRRPVAGRADRGQRDQARRVPRADAQGPARAGDPLAGQAAGAGGPGQGQGREASEAVDLRLRAGRHGDQGHELRLADADRGPDRRHRSEAGAAARGEDRRQHEAHPVPPRRRVRADARLPHRRGRRSTARRRGSPAPRSRTWPMPSSWRRRRPASPRSTTGST